MASSSAKSAQDFVPIKEVRDSVFVLQDGSLRTVLMVSSLNFALKSEDNQAAIIAQFQDFLNSLDFSVEIFLQSRKMDIRPYLALLDERLRLQESELMKIQTREYIEFIKTFTESTNIMTKTFFVVIPFVPGAAAVKKNPLLAVSDIVSGLAKKTSDEATARGSENFEENKIQLQQRVAVVEQGLIRCGLRTAHLGSEEIIELFYKTFNPGEVEKPIPIT